MKTSLLMLAMLVLLSACQSTQLQNTTQIPDQYITIGILTARSGPYAPYGDSFLRGVQAAIDDAAQQGINVRVIVANNSNDPKVAATALKQLSQKNPDIIVSTFSAPTVAVTPLTEKLGTPLIMSMLLFTPNKVYNNSFRYYFTTQDIADALVSTLQSKKVKTIGIYYQNTDANIYSLQAVEKKLIEAGITVSAKQSFEADEAENMQPFSEITNTKPDAIYVLTNRPDEIILSLKQLYKGQIYFNEVSAIYDFYKLNTFDDVYMIAPQFIAEQTPAHELFVSKFGNAENSFAAFGYDTLSATIAAVKQTGDAKQVTSWLRSQQSFTGISGKATVEQFGQTSMQLVVIKKENGTVQIVS